MPRIPTYDNPQVEERALPGFRQSSVASPALFGAKAEQVQRLGGAVTSVGKTASDIALDMQHRENADMIFRAETSLKDDYLQFEKDAYSRKGINANGVTADAETFFGDQAKKHAKLLQNDEQRRLFNVSLTRMRQSSMGQFARYEAQEGDRALDSSTQATIVGTINLAAADAANGRIVPSRTHEGEAVITRDEHGVETVSAPGVTVGNNPIDGYRRDIKNRVAVLAGLRGMAKPEQQGLEDQYVSDMHVQVLQNLVDTDAGKAREYYAQHKDEVLGTQRDGVERALKVGGLRETAQSAADAATRQGLTEAQALAQARKDYSGEEEVAVVGEIKARYGEAQQLREQGQRQAADQAWKIYADTGSLKTIPTSVITQMDGRDVEALRAHAQNKAAGVSVKTDPGVYYDLRTLAAEDPDAFRNADLRQYVNVLSPSDFQEFVKLQTASDSEKLESVSQQQQLNQVHEQMRWGKNDKDKKGAFDKAATDTIRAEQLRRGRKLTQEERQQVIDKLLIQGQGGWFSSGPHYFEVLGTPEAATFEPEVDDTSRQQIVERFVTRNGREPTTAEIQQIYKKWKGF